MLLRIDQLRLDGGTQPRAEINRSILRDYADALSDETIFPPVTVFYDGAAYWLADGFHRVHAHKYLNWLEVEADVHQGTQRDAVLYSVGANAVHGLRRTNDDKRRAVETLLNDPEWAGWSDREISRRAGVNHEMVGKLRPEPVTGGNRQLERTYTTKHGTQATMQTAGIGKRPTPAPPAPKTAPAGVDPQTGEVLDATFPFELLQAAYAPMSPAPWSPPPHEEVMAEGRLKEVSSALNELKRKMSQLKDSDFDLLLTGGALRFRLIAIAEEWLRIYRNETDSSDAFTLDMIVDA